MASQSQSRAEDMFSEGVAVVGLDGRRRAFEVFGVFAVTCSPPRVREHVFECVRCSGVFGQGVFENTVTTSCNTDHGFIDLSPNVF